MIYYAINIGDIVCIVECIVEHALLYIGSIILCVSLMSVHINKTTLLV